VSCCDHGQDRARDDRDPRKRKEPRPRGDTQLKSVDQADLTDLAAHSIGARLQSKRSGEDKPKTHQEEYRADHAASPGLQHEHEQCPGQCDYRQRLTQSAGDLSSGELHHDAFAASPPPRLCAGDEAQDPAEQQAAECQCASLHSAVDSAIRSADGPTEAKLSATEMALTTAAALF